MIEAALSTYVTVAALVGVVFAAMSSSVFAAVFVLSMMAAIIAGGLWIHRRDQERPRHR